MPAAARQPPDAASAGRGGRSDTDRPPSTEGTTMSYLRTLRTAAVTAVIAGTVLLPATGAFAADASAKPPPARAPPPRA
ncbi:hypothetical protein O3W51_43005, partial [Streptomyces sp. H39-C1]|nr:hypothetical protein [Streptomyces sp. H39-C1]